MKKQIIFSIILCLCLFSTRSLPAAEPASVESQLRDRLRATMLQLRTAETERAQLQATQTQCADDLKVLTARNEALIQKVNENKLTAQVASELKSQLAGQEKEIAQLKASLESEQHTAELARTKEAERAKVVEEVVIGLERLVADRQAKNLALYKTATEILDRYEKFGLGDAITAREPFVGITRVKLQNQVQDYQDKITADRVTLTEKDLTTYRDKLLQASK